MLNTRPGYAPQRNPVAGTLLTPSCVVPPLKRTESRAAYSLSVEDLRATLRSTVAKLRNEGHRLSLQRSARLRRNYLPDSSPFPDVAIPVRERCTPVSLPIFDCQLPICNSAKPCQFQSPTTVMTLAVMGTRTIGNRQLKIGNALTSVPAHLPRLRRPRTRPSVPDRQD